MQAQTQPRLDFASLRETMAERQIRTFNVVDQPVIEQFLITPREIFTPPDQLALAYSDAELRLPLESGGERRMLAPLALARLMQNARVEPHHRVLDVGGGSGYSAALLSGMAEHVVALESDAGLTTRAQNNLRALGRRNVSFVTGPLAEGVSGQGPYDVIFVNGAIAVQPDKLLTQVREGGCLVAFHVSARGAAHAGLHQKEGGKFSFVRLFDACATVLPEFHKPALFIF